MIPSNYRLSPTPVVQGTRLDPGTTSPQQLAVLAQSSPILYGDGRDVLGGRMSPPDQRIRMGESQVIQSARRIYARHLVRTPSPALGSSSNALSFAIPPQLIPSPIDRRIDAAVAVAVRCHSPPPAEGAVSSFAPRRAGPVAVAVVSRPRESQPELQMPRLPVPASNAQAQEPREREQGAFVSAAPQATLFPRGHTREASFLELSGEEIDGNTHTSFDEEQLPSPPRQMPVSSAPLSDPRELPSPPHLVRQPDPSTHQEGVLIQWLRQINAAETRTSFDKEPSAPILDPLPRPSTSVIQKREPLAAPSQQNQEVSVQNRRQQNRPAERKLLSSKKFTPRKRLSFPIHIFLRIKQFFSQKIEDLIKKIKRFI